MKQMTIEEKINKDLNLLKRRIASCYKLILTLILASLSFIGIFPVIPIENLKADFKFSCAYFEIDYRHIVNVYVTVLILLFLSIILYLYVVYNLGNRRRYLENIQNKN